MIPGIESITGPLFYGGAFALASLIGMGFAGILRWPATAAMLTMIAAAIGVWFSTLGG